jgi:chemotaxis protein histidine kinase CheA
LAVILKDVLAQLTQKFIELSADRLDGIDQSIDDILNDKGDRGTLYNNLQMEIHSLKGSAGSYGFHLVTTIAHRLEDYMESSSRLENEQWLDVQKFIDEARRIIEQGQDPDESLYNEILKVLPSSSSKEFSGSDINSITVFLVMESGVQRKLVGTELASQGINISFSNNPLEAIDQIFNSNLMS